MIWLAFGVTTHTPEAQNLPVPHGLASLQTGAKVGVVVGPLASLVALESPLRPVSPPAAVSKDAASALVLSSLEEPQPLAKAPSEISAVHVRQIAKEPRKRLDISTSWGAGTGRQSEPRRIAAIGGCGNPKIADRRALLW
jgi:hypothetical protein